MFFPYNILFSSTFVPFSVCVFVFWAILAVIETSSLPNYSVKKKMEGIEKMVRYNFNEHVWCIEHKLYYILVQFYSLNSEQLL